MPKNNSIKKVLMIGSGPIVIGQAAEFDYAGAQACRVLKEENVDVVLVNSNPATIMTDKTMASEVYLEPLNVETVERIIEKERPDGILAGLGGQTALTIAMQLEKRGTLKKYGVKLLGTQMSAIKTAEDRESFRNKMREIGQPVIPSEIATTVKEAVNAAKKIGYPVIIRPAYTLGGSGGGIADTEEELTAIAKNGLEISPITQILVERSVAGWKEIEFETMRDSVGNVISVCSMENVDPVGVHTGDSVVVAPALTLSDKEYQKLRSAALSIISAIGIVGGCNCQFALDPKSFEYAVIEVNPRVSRSSALASKASGYPIAKITTKIALGYNLGELKNEITGKTCACFEPALDYIALKFPKWPFDKFQGASRQLGTQMKATGEVMSIARSFEAALMKAVRGAEISLDTLSAAPVDGRDVRERLKDRDDRRIFTVFEAIKKGVGIDEIHEITKIDEWFLYKIKNLADFEERIEKGLSDEDYYLGKKLGFTDCALSRISGRRDLPTKKPVYKTVDTCAAEFAAETPYFYSTADDVCEARAHKRSGRPVVLVLGSGPIRIGQGIEFDYSSVHSVWTLKKLGYEVVIINNNPETVSTDYDTADRLYFEPLTPEDVMGVIDVENPVGVVVAFGGQTAIKLTEFLDKNGIKILGTSAEGIDLAEDREKFDALLEKLGIKRPKGFAAHTEKEAVEVAEKLGYPVLLRPSYVIGGQNMRIVYSREETERYMRRIFAEGVKNSVLIDKYMSGTELEVDVISDGENVLIPGVMEHVERAGVHSGDSIAVYPPFNLNDKMTKTIVDSSVSLAKSLGTKGLVNIQYLIYGGELYVIEVNPRASRTVPYISKITGVPMADVASEVMLGKKLTELPYGTGLYKTPPYYAVKVPVFSFEKLTDVNSYLGPEMKSTGEVLGLGRTLEEALFKGLTSAGMVVRTERNKKQGVLISADTHDQREIVGLAKKFEDLGFDIYATPETAGTVASLGMEVSVIKSIKEKGGAYELMENRKISYVVYTGALSDETTEDYIALSRKALALSVPCFTSLDTANALADVIKARYNLFNTELVDINHMRTERVKVKFSKMQATGDDYIFIDNRDGKITCPESLCIDLCSRHYGIGGYGIVLIENSETCDIKMRVFNKDGSEGVVAGNCMRSVGKFVYDEKIVDKENMTVETAAGAKRLTLYTRFGKVNYVSAHMGKPEFSPAKIPCTLSGDKIIDVPYKVGGEEYGITCLSVGNPHCVVFVPSTDGVDIGKIGPKFENADIFPERTNTEFVRVVNENTLKMRAYERGNGETYSCGSGACAAVVAATEKGLIKKNRDVTVKVKGGDLTVNYSEDGITLSGDTVLVYKGEFEF